MTQYPVYSQLEQFGLHDILVDFLVIIPTDKENESLQLFIKYSFHNI